MDEEILVHEGPMPGAVIYISEFQNKVAWKFGISVSLLCNKRNTVGSSQQWIEDYGGVYAALFGPTLHTLSRLSVPSQMKWRKRQTQIVLNVVL